MVQAIEVDFLPVGTGEHSGDAIAIRWKKNDQVKVLIYDGGTTEYGKQLVAHVQEYFETDTVDYVVNSHPDNDHAGGLEFVLSNLKVGELWLHRPWERSAEIRNYFRDGRMTNQSLASRLKQKMSAAHELEQVAIALKIPIKEPFAGAKIGIFSVLSPSEHRYVHELIPQFEKSPELKEETSAMEAFKGSVDCWDDEDLPDTVKTSAENESSAILYARTSNGGYLLTGDAGVKSLRAAYNHAVSMNLDVAENLRFVQIPHHGGRHNVSSETLDLLIGRAINAENTQSKRTAFVSASMNAPKHPKRVVTNAFIRRGFKVIQTKGKIITHGHGFPARADWASASLVPFHWELD